MSFANPIPPTSSDSSLQIATNAQGATDIKFVSAINGLKFQTSGTVTGTAVNGGTITGGSNFAVYAMDFPTVGTPAAEGLALTEYIFCNNPAYIDGGIQLSQKYVALTTGATPTHQVACVRPQYYSRATNDASPWIGSTATTYTAGSAPAISANLITLPGTSGQTGQVSTVTVAGIPDNARIDLSLVGMSFATAIAAPVVAITPNVNFTVTGTAGAIYAYKVLCA